MMSNAIPLSSWLFSLSLIIFIIAVLLPSAVLSQNSTSENPAVGVTLSSSSDDVNDNLPTTPPSSLPLPQVIIKFAQLVAFHEQKHEAEFILQVVLPGEMQDNNSKLKSSLENLFLNARSLEMISSRPHQQITNGSQSNSMEVKLKVIIGCDMHYTLYPFESHLCSMISLGNMASPVFCGELKAYEFHVKGYLAVPLLPPPATAGKKKPQFDQMAKKNDGGLIVNAIHLIVSRTSAMQIYSQMYSPVMLLVMLSFLTMLDATSLPIRIWTSLSMLLCGVLITTIFWRDVPRAGEGDVTFTEYYFAFGVGFLFQAFFTNILMHWYTSLALKKSAPPPPSSTPPAVSKNRNNLLANGPSPKNGDVEANIRNISDFTESSKTADVRASKGDYNVESVETYILTLGKFHKYMYFKILKPAKKQLPIAFLIFNVIFWVLLLYLSGGLPNGFQYLPAATAETAMFCL